MESEEVPERVLLVTVDSLRYDAYPLMEHTTEFLGESHDRAFATATATALSFPSIISGTYATEAGISNEESVVSRFADHQTFGYQSNPLLTSEYGYAQGFDTYNESERERGLKDEIANILPLGANPLYKLGTRAYNAYQWAAATVRPATREYVSVETLVDAAIDDLTALDDPTAESWFVWIHVMEPHHPYNPGTEWTDVSRAKAQRLSRKAMAHRVSDDETADLVRHLYRGEVRETDAHLARLWEWIPDDTRVVFCADHGEYLGEGDIWGHFNEFGRETVQVPLATRNAPVPEGEVVSLIDVPTLLLGTEFGEGRFDRDIAFAARNGKTLATDGHAIVSSDGAEWLTEDEQEEARLGRLERARARFEQGYTQVNLQDEVNMDDLRDLGYV